MHINYRIYTIIGKGKNEQTKTKLKYNALPNLFILFYFLILRYRNIHSDDNTYV